MVKFHQERKKAQDGYIGQNIVTSPKEQLPQITNINRQKFCETSL
jgi:hypothetical protein